MRSLCISMNTFIYGVTMTAAVGNLAYVFDLCSIPQLTFKTDLFGAVAASADRAHARVR